MIDSVEHLETRLASGESLISLSDEFAEQLRMQRGFSEAAPLTEQRVREIICEELTRFAKIQRGLQRNEARRFD